MAVQDSRGQTVFASDTTLLLQTLLMTPVGADKHRHGSTDLPGDVLDALGAAETQALLQTLLTTPLPSAPQLRPVTLFGIEALRRAILKDRRGLDQFDTLLWNVERSLAIVALLALGTWATLGPVGNWLHKQYTPTITSAPARQIAPMPAALVRSKPASSSLSTSISQLRPMDTPKQSQAVEAPQEDYFAPRLRPNQSPVVDLPAQPTHLFIQSIGLDAPIVEVFFIDGDWEVAHYAAGYLHGTGLPGDVGNVVIAGHAGFFGGVFANLGGLAKGDDIYIDAAGWRYHYRVRKSIVVWPTQTEVMLPTDIPILTLITCTNWDLQRLVIVADLIGDRPL